MKPRFELCFVLAAISSMAPLRAANPTTSTTTSIPAPVFEVPRLKSHHQPGDLPGIGKTSVTVDDLKVHPGDNATTATQNNVSYLKLAAGQNLIRSLRGSPKDTTFVSFSVNASDGTLIDLGAARLAVGPSDRTGYLRLKLGIPAGNDVNWRPLDEMKIQNYDGVALAPLPTLTIRLDPANGVWDLYVFNRLAAEDLPLPDMPPGSAKRFDLHAGSNGAWLLGLIDSDENTLYVDANHNGIDDTFEKSQNGGSLLTANATAAARSKIVQAWKLAQRTSATAKPWPVHLPQPDKS